MSAGFTIGLALGLAVAVFAVLFVRGCADGAAQ